MVENILMQHDPELLYFLTNQEIKPELYAWPILRTAFSEILTAPCWKIFWDHVLINEPSFLLCGVVAYNMLQRTAILSLKDPKQFKCYYSTHHPIDVKKLLAKTYHILAHTSDSIHPRQYLNMFKKIRLGEYPNFCDYPKTIVEFKSEKENAMKEEMISLKTDEVDLFRQRLVRLEKLENFEIQEEENKRILGEFLIFLNFASTYKKNIVSVKKSLLLSASLTLVWTWKTPKGLRTDFYSPFVNLAQLFEGAFIFAKKTKLGLTLLTVFRMPNAMHFSIVLIYCE